MTPKGRLIAVAVLLAGPAVLAWSVLYTTDYRQWSTDVLVGIGSSFLLFVPLYFFGRALDRHIEIVRDETASNLETVREVASTQVAELTERVSHFEQDIDRRLDELAASVTNSLRMEHDLDETAFRTLGETPTAAGLEEAMRRATEIGLVSPKRPPRLPPSQDQEIYVYVLYDSAADKDSAPNERFTFGIEDLKGVFLAQIEWQAGESLEGVIVRLSRAVQRETGDGFDITAFFQGLSELLIVANMSPEHRPIVQLCGPQWAVTTNGIVTYDGSTDFAMSHGELSTRGSEERMLAEPWIDKESFAAAYNVSRRLYPYAFWS